jgi:hypothetical protein
MEQGIEVVGISEEPSLDTLGNVFRYKVVRFKVDGLGPITERFTEAEFNENVMRERIGKAAAAIRSVKKL